MAWLVPNGHDGAISCVYCSGVTRNLFWWCTPKSV